MFGPSVRRRLYSEQVYNFRHLSISMYILLLCVLSIYRYTKISTKPLNALEIRSRSSDLRHVLQLHTTNSYVVATTQRRQKTGYGDKVPFCPYMARIVSGTLSFGHGLTDALNYLGEKTWLRFVGISYGVEITFML